MTEALAAADADPKTAMTDATCVKTRRTASSPRVKKAVSCGDRSHERPHEYQGSPKPVEGLHAVADANGRRLNLFMTDGQVSDYADAATLLDRLPKTR